VHRYVLAALLLVGFATASAQDWVEVKSPHFSVITDAGEGRGRDIAQRFEEMRASFGALFGKQKVTIATPLTIVAFRNTRDFQAFVPRYNGKPVNWTGFFRGGDDHNFIALDTSASNSFEVVFHEYAHLLINGNFPPMPVWFDEGFAEYCSSLKITGKQIEFGLPREDLVRVLQASAWMRPLQLFAVAHDSREYNEGDRRSLFYAQSWITVHYLMANNLGKQLTVFLDLTQNQKLDFAEGIRQAFGVEPKNFENAVRNYFTVGRLSYFRAPVPADLGKVPFEVRKLPQSDWLSAWADLHYHSADHHAEGVELFKKVLAMDPGNVAANRGLGYAYLQQNEFSKAAECFERAAAGDSKDARVHYFSALLANREAAISGKPPEKLDAIKQHLNIAIQLDPNYADAYHLLSWAEAASGNKDAARKAIERAVELNPRNDFYALTMAQYELQANQFEKARPVLERLEGSDQPEIAHFAHQALATLGERKPATSINSPRQQITAPQWQTKEPETPPPTEQQPLPSVEVATRAPSEAKPQSIQFLKGTLVAIDCSKPPMVSITVASKGKNWMLFTRDVQKLMLIGVENFSCNWTNKKASVNYRPQADGRGEIVSLEID